jgi:hypothetical protein
MIETATLADPSRTYTLVSTAWPEQLADEVDRLLIGDVVVTWRAIDGLPTTAELSALDDAWDVLAEVATILAELTVQSASEALTPAQVIERLEAHGFRPSEYHGRVKA